MASLLHREVGAKRRTVLTSMFDAEYFIQILGGILLVTKLISSLLMLFLKSLTPIQGME